MAPMRTMLLLIALIAISNALVVGPTIYEQKDMGDISLKEFVYSLSADCTASTITVSVMDENYSAVGGVNTYMQYAEFSTQLMSNVKTDAEGIALHRLPGDVKLMRGLFILVIEKYGFRNKEVHFDLSPCYTNGTVKPPKPVPPGKNQTNNTSQNSSGNYNNQSNGSNGNTGTPNASASNASQNITNNTGTNPAPGENGSICPSAILVAVLAFGGGLIAFMKNRRPRPRSWVGASTRYKSFKR